MARSRRAETTRSMPLTLTALREHGALDSLSPPGNFDPNERWEHTYRIWLVGKADCGFLRIERESASGSNSVTLSVETSILQSAKTVHHTKAKLQCAGDTLSTPQSWEIESEILDTDLQPIEVAKVKETAIVKDGTIAVTAEDHSFTRKIPATFTSNWSLFDVVQRLLGKDAVPLEFDLLEDLDLLKEGQRLSYWQSTEFDVGDDTLQLVGYQQIGAGVLPYQYWVDDQHRLLLAISGVRAYIFDTDIHEDLGQRLRKLARNG